MSRVNVSLSRATLGRTFRLTTLAFAVALTAGPAFAVPGDPDRNFGPDGVRILQNGGAGDVARAVEPAGNGAAYVAGQWDPVNPAGNIYQMGVAKVTALGELDTGYGCTIEQAPPCDGVATFGFPSDGDVAYAMAREPGGKLIVAGAFESNGANSDTGVARLDANGRLDPTFGNVVAGTTRSGFTFRNNGSDGAANDFATAVAVQGGKILVAGVGKVNVRTLGKYDRFSLTRFDENGNYDPTFTIGDAANPNVAPPLQPDDTAPNPSIEIVTGIAKRADGTLAPTDPITVVGYEFRATTGIIRRYLTTGQPDPNFGNGGVLLLPALRDNTGVYSGFSRIVSAVLLDDGRMLVAGYGGDEAFTVIRLSATGQLDTTFGTAGRASVRFGQSNDGDLPTSMVVQRNGKIVVAGQARVNTAANNIDFGVARLLPTGLPDTRFATQGRYTAPLSSKEDEPLGVAILSDDAIMAVGYAVDAAAPALDYDFAMLRLFGDDDIFADSFE